MILQKYLGVVILLSLFDGLIKESLLFFDEKQYDEAIEKLLDALEAITDKSTLIREQILTLDMMKAQRARQRRVWQITLTHR